MAKANYTNALEQFENHLPEKNGTFMQADETLKAVYRNVIQKHENVQFLARWNIKLLFRVKEQQRKGRVVLGYAKTFSAEEQLIHPYSGLIVIDYNTWFQYPDRREPLVHHECSHFMEEVSEKDGSIKLGTVDHDFAEFYQVIKAHGDWKGDMRPLRHIQGELFPKGEVIPLKPVD